MAKTVALKELNSDFSNLVLAAKAEYCKDWELQKDICLKYSRMHEMELLEEVAKVFGIDPTTHEEIQDLTDAIWEAAKDYIITIKS